MDANLLYITVAAVFIPPTAEKTSGVNEPCSTSRIRPPFIAAPLLPFMSLVYWFYGGVAVAWCINKGWRPLYQKWTLVACPPESLCRHIDLAPSSVFAVLCWNCSPVSIWRSGSTATLWQTSERRLAVMSLLSLCLSEGNPPCEQLKACSTVKCFPRHNCLKGGSVAIHSVGLVHPGMPLYVGWTRVQLRVAYLVS